MMNVFQVRVLPRHRADLQELSAVQRRDVRVHAEGQEAGRGHSGDPGRVCVFVLFYDQLIF